MLKLADGSTHSHEGEVVTHEMASLIGTAILIGFTAMLLIDEVVNKITESKAHSDEPSGSLNDDQREM